MPTPSTTMPSPLPGDHTDGTRTGASGPPGPPAADPPAAAALRQPASAPAAAAPNRFGLSPAQIGGSALAAMTSALAASTLGVAGTLAGAAIGSLIATIGSAMYAHTFRTAHRRIEALAPRPGRPLRPTEVRSARAVASGPRDAPAAAHPSPSGRWRGPATFLAGLLVALGAVTAVELVLGHPLGSSALPGTTVTRVVTGGGTARARSTRPNDTHQGQPTLSPPTAAPTPTLTPSPTTTPSPGPTPTASVPSTTPTPTTTP